MFCGVNAGTIRENRRHGKAIFYQKKKGLVSRFAARIIHSSRGSGTITSSLRTSTIWAPPRAASVGKSFALLNINPAPTVKKLKVTERVREVIYPLNE
jgi:hypothetical protein